MRGYHDELGGPDSIAGPEWGALSFGDEGMTAAGLPATEVHRYEDHGNTLTVRVTYRLESPSEYSAEYLRHNYLKRREIENPSYGVVPGDGWRERCLSALGVSFVDDAPPVLVARNRRERGRHLPSSRKPPFGG